MTNFIEKITGDLEEKKLNRQNEAKAKKLPHEYAVAYREIKQYIFRTSGIETIRPLVALVDMLEEAAADGRHVLDVMGADVAAFADELVRGETSYQNKQREKLNKEIAKKLNNQ